MAKGDLKNHFLASILPKNAAVFVVTGMGPDGATRTIGPFLTRKEASQELRRQMRELKGWTFGIQ